MCVIGIVWVANNKFLVLFSLAPKRKKISEEGNKFSSNESIYQFSKNFLKNVYWNLKTCQI